MLQQITIDSRGRAVYRHHGSDSEDYSPVYVTDLGGGRMSAPYRNANLGPAEDHGIDPNDPYGDFAERRKRDDALHEDAVQKALAAFGSPPVPAPAQPAQPARTPARGDYRTASAGFYDEMEADIQANGLPEKVSGPDGRKTVSLRPEVVEEIAEIGRKAKRRGPFARAITKQQEEEFEAKRRASRAGGKRAIGETAAKPEPMSDEDKETVARIKRNVDILAGPRDPFEGL